MCYEIFDLINIFLMLIIKDTVIKKTIKSRLSQLSCQEPQSHECNSPKAFCPIYFQPQERKRVVLIEASYFID